MGLLNSPSDGLPSVLWALVRTLRCLGPLPQETLLAVCAPPTLQAHQKGFEAARQAAKTLLRWTQLGLFLEEEGHVRLHTDVLALPEQAWDEMLGLAPILRACLFHPANNQALHQDEGALAADWTLGLCWALAQDLFALPGGPHADVWKLEEEQFEGPPYAFRNDVRWNTFRAWAPVLGFGWTEGPRTRPLLVLDPTAAVRDALPTLFASTAELSLEDWLYAVAEALPVLDGGRYRQQVEARLRLGAWRPTAAHEVSVSLSVALLRLDSAGHIRLQARADAPKRVLLGQGFRELQQVSHVVWTGRPHA
jgi:hypothetical protein